MMRKHRAALPLHLGKIDQIHGAGFISPSFGKLSAPCKDAQHKYCFKVSCPCPCHPKPVASWRGNAA